VQGYISYLLFTVVIRDVISLLQEPVQLHLVSGSRFENTVLLFLPLLFDILGRVPLWLGPSVQRVKVPLAKGQGFKIAQISDLHIGPGMQRGYVQKVVDLVNAEKPDIIALTGDIVDHLDKWFADDIHLLKNLQARFGVFFIPGNHEYYWGYHPVIKSMERMGFHVLDNKNKILSFASAKIAICGTTDFAAAMFQMEGPDLVKARAGAESADLRILLSHQPKIADESAQQGYDLQLSGHTHAGQFVPWSLLIRLFQKYPKGLFRVGKMFLYVNQGTGYWGPANRLGTWPEITLLELAP
jgi:predicted MPP superfamily phosphohydrolase